MPTRLGRNYTNDRIRYIYGARAEQLAPVAVLAQPPWGGCRPDLPNALRDWASFSSTKGLISTEGNLTNDDGWTRLSPATLPLGNDSTPPASGANEQPINGLYQFGRVDNGASVRVQLVAMTAKTGGNDGYGFYNDTTNGWTVLADEGGSANRFSATEGFLKDFCTFPAGAPNRGGWGWGGSYVNITRVCCVVASGIDAGCDPVKVIYPTSGGEALTCGKLYKEFGGANDFYARSVCTFFERVLYGATKENTVECRQRVRWTVPADASDLTGIGSGAMDLTEFRRDIMRVIPMGSVCAVYAYDGIAFLTPTGDYTAPYFRQYIDRRRGPIGPRAVCAINLDTHFFIAHDGWFMLNGSGQVIRVGVREDGAQYWMDTFYRRLNPGAADTITCAYDSLRHLVRIAFPTSQSTTNTEVWHFDVETGNVWFDDYGTHGTGLYTPSYFAMGDQTIGADETWDASVGSWDTDTKTWDETAPRIGLGRGIFGTRRGFVFQYDPTTINRDGVPPSWFAIGTVSPLGNPASLKTSDTLWIEHTDYLNSASWSAGFIGYDGTLAATAVSASTGGHYGANESSYVNARLTSHELGWYIAGTGPVNIQSIRAHILADVGERVRAQT